LILALASFLPAELLRKFERGPPTSGNVPRRHEATVALRLSPRNPQEF
jgi:hypothetical protein